MVKKIFLAIFILTFIGLLAAYIKARVLRSEVIKEVEMRQVQKVIVTATPSPTTESAVQSFLANKYSKPLSDVHVTIEKEVPGYAYGSVLFGQGGPGEGGMWIATLGNGWSVVWDGNGNVDCTKMRQDYGVPDTILVPNFCN